MNASSEQLIQQAVSEAKIGNRKNARKIIKQVVIGDVRNKRAWYVLSQLVENRQQEEYCLRKFLEIEPGNTQVRERLSQIENLKDIDIASVESPASTKLCPFYRSAFDKGAIVCPQCARDLSPLPYACLVLISLGSGFMGIGCFLTFMCVVVPIIIYLFSQLICK